MNVTRAVMAAVVVSVVVAGTQYGGQGSKGTPASAVETANFWLDTDGGTCSRNSSAAAYVDASACSNLNTAYAAASCGDTIFIKAGTYGGNNGEVINARSGDTVCGSDVTIQGASGETVNLGASTTVSGAGQDVTGGTLNVASTTGFPSSGSAQITGVNSNGLCDYSGKTSTSFTGITSCSGGTHIPADGAGVYSAHTGTCKVNTINDDYCGSHVVFKNVNFALSLFIPQGANNVTMDNVIIGAAGGSIFPSGNSFTLKNSLIGPATAGATTGSDGFHLDTDGGCVVNGTTCLQPTTYTVQDNVFRNTVCRPIHCASGDALDHTDAMQFLAGSSITVQRNRFYNVDDAVIYGCEHSSACTSFVFQNNMVKTSGEVTYAVQVSSVNLTTATISFNSFASGTIIAGGGPYTVDSNWLLSWGSSTCTSLTGAGGTFTYNMLPFGSTQCGATNTVLGNGILPSFTDATNGDLHVPAGASYQGNGLGNPSGGPSTDFDSGARGSPPDVGADES